MQVRLLSTYTVKVLKEAKCSYLSEYSSNYNFTPKRLITPASVV